MNHDFAVFQRLLATLRPYVERYIRPKGSHTRCPRELLLLGQTGQTVFSGPVIPERLLSSHPVERNVPIAVVQSA